MRAVLSGIPNQTDGQWGCEDAACMSVAWHSSLHGCVLLVVARQVQHPANCCIHQALHPVWGVQHVLGLHSNSATIHRELNCANRVIKATATNPLTPLPIQKAWTGVLTSNSTTSSPLQQHNHYRCQSLRLGVKAILQRELPAQVHAACALQKLHGCDVHNHDYHARVMPPHTCHPVPQVVPAQCPMPASPAEPPAAQCLC